METESYLHESSPITHFQYEDQYNTLLKIKVKRGHFNNQCLSLHDVLANRTLLVLIENNCWLLPTQCPTPYAGLYDILKMILPKVQISFQLVETPILHVSLADIFFSYIPGFQTQI